MELVYSQTHSGESPEAWAAIHLADAQLGDSQRRARAETIGRAMAESPGEAIPQLFGRKYDVKATYTFFDREEATPDNIQVGHREWTRQEITKPGRYLLPEDTSTFTYSHRENIPGFGPVGNRTRGKNHQGFHLHSTLALRWPDDLELDAEEEAERPPVDVIGVLEQQYHVRKKRRKKHDRSKRKRALKNGELESQLWEESIRRTGRAPDDEEVQWIRVCDRGADIYEHTRDCQDYGYGFVIRAGKNRGLEDPGTGDPGGTLFNVAREAKPLGTFQLNLRARPGQPARTADLSVSATKIAIRSPHRPGHPRGSQPAIECWVVRVYEENPPKGVKPLEWILLTDQPVETREQAIEIALIYSTRWIIEEFHKALKTGCKAEELQFEEGHRFFAAIAIMSLVALRLIHFREQFRINPNAPAEESGFDALEIEILEKKLNRQIKTVKDVAMAVGRLGGHMNRPSDGMPGWITLWRGMKKLSVLKEGAILSTRLSGSGV